MQSQNYQWQNYAVGVCYYPEHWPRSMWRDDLARMKAAGISTVRVAEFAWSIFEPQEEVFSFAFFDGFLALCEETGVKVIFGTPTATPPAWLTEKYPETLNAFMEARSFPMAQDGTITTIPLYTAVFPPASSSSWPGTTASTPPLSAGRLTTNSTAKRMSFTPPPITRHSGCFSRRNTVPWTR